MISCHFFAVRKRACDGCWQARVLHECLFNYHLFFPRKKLARVLASGSTHECLLLWTVSTLITRHAWQSIKFHPCLTSVHPLRVFPILWRFLSTCILISNCWNVSTWPRPCCWRFLTWQVSGNMLNAGIFLQVNDVVGSYGWFMF